MLSNIDELKGSILERKNLANTKIEMLNYNTEK